MNKEKIEAQIAELERLANFFSLDFDPPEEQNLPVARSCFEAAATMRDMLAENERLREENNQVRNDLLDLVEEQKDSALLKRIEALVKENELLKQALCYIDDEALSLDSAENVAREALATIVENNKNGTEIDSSRTQESESIREDNAPSS